MKYTTTRNHCIFSSI